MDTLPEPLRETARLRMEYPDLTLARLAEKFDPPVSKAGLSHRFKRIQEAARRVEEARRQSSTSQSPSRKEVP